MNKTITKLITVFAAIMLLQSCDMGHDKAPDFSEMKFDIEDASQLFIGKEKTSRNAKSAVSNPVMYKVKKDGTIAAVTYSNRNNKKKVTPVVPEFIEELNDKYLFFVGQSINSFCTPIFLINRENGYVYEWKDLYPARSYNNGKQGTTYRGTNKTWTDKNNNMYFKVIKYNSPDSPLGMVNISNPDNINVKAISFKDDEVMELKLVDYDGNAIYYGENVNNERITRLRLADGSFKRNADIPEIKYAWTNPDNKTYIIGTSNNISGNIHQIKISKTEPYITTMPMLEEYDTNISNGESLDYEIHEFNNKKHILVTGSDFYEIYNPSTNKMKKINTDSFKISGIKISQKYGNDLFVLGKENSGIKDDKGYTEVYDKDRFLKINTNNYTFEELPFNSDRFEIYNFSISDNGLIFNAMDYDNGSIVVGQYDYNNKNPGTNTKILTENLEEQVTILNRIN